MGARVTDPAGLSYSMTNRVAMLERRSGVESGCSQGLATEPQEVAWEQP